MILAGPYRAFPLSTGRFRLDGGAMFGNVPRVLWEREHPADASHRILLELRVLLLEGEGRRILVDTGSGNQWSEKEQGLYDVQAPPEPGVVSALRHHGVDPGEITDVILSHLHFDHAGGVSRRSEDGRPVPTFPAARHHIQRRNLDNARSPNERERRSYLARHVDVLEQVDLHVHEGDGEIMPALWVRASDGHTRGLQVVRAGEGENTVVFPADMVPLGTHVRVPWTMGYDLCPERLMDEKRVLLENASEQGWKIVLEHDVRYPAVLVERSGGHFEARPWEPRQPA